MRFLANENIPASTVRALTALGHDMTWVRLAKPGARDREVLDWAVRELRVLLTFDKDFGELAVGAALPRECGVVLFRLQLNVPGAKADPLAAIVHARRDWPGHFSVVEPGRVRMRPLSDR